jgi:trigger factor
LETSIEELSSVAKKITVTIPYEDFRGAIDAEYEKIRKDLAIPGFRRGKAPRHIVDMKLGPALQDEAVKTLVPKSLEEALDEHKLSPISEPVVEKINVEKDQPLTFKATVEILPEFDVDGYKGVKITAAERKPVTDEDVDQTVESIRKQHATQVPVEDRPAAKDDFVVVDFSHEIDDKKNSEKDRTFRLDDSVMPEFMENIIGMNLGENKDFEVVLADDYPKKELAGKTARYSLELKEIKSEQLPELDDELAKQAGEYETLDKLKEQLRDNITIMREQEAVSEEKNQLMDVLLEKHPIEVPQSLVERQAKYNIQRRVQESMFRGISREEIEQNREQIAEAAREASRSQIAWQLVLEKIAKAESIEATDEEVDERVEEMARYKNQDPADTRQYIEKNNMIEDIRHEIVFKKVINFLHENAVKKPAGKSKKKS